MAFYPELDGLSLQALIDVYQAPCPDHEAPEIWFSEVGFAIAESDPEGVEFLLAEASRADVPRLGGILLGVSTSPPTDAVRALLWTGLEHDDPSIVMSAIDGLTCVRELSARQRVSGFRSHESEYVVGAVLRYLATLFPEDSLPVMLEALSDPRSIVRECAVDALDELAEPVGPTEAARIALLLDDPHPHVREAARWFVDHWRSTSNE